MDSFVVEKVLAIMCVHFIFSETEGQWGYPCSCLLSSRAKKKRYLLAYLYFPVKLGL